MIALSLAAALAAQAISVDPETPPEVTTAFQAWAGCITEGVEADDGERSPRQAAEAILAACRSRQTALSAAHGRWVDASGLSEREKAEARRSMAQSVEALGGQVARMIRMQRDD